jgi:hypothetical protein
LHQLFFSATRAGHQDLQLMRSSYGFKKFLQAIYVVFDRAAIVTSHDAHAVSASITLPTCDASLRRPKVAAPRASSSARIFTEKNRLFCSADCWRSLFALFFARLTRGVWIDHACSRDIEKTRRKNF